MNFEESSTTDSFANDQREENGCVQMRASSTSRHSGLRVRWVGSRPLQPRNTVIDSLGKLWKRVFDLIISSISLVVLSPLFLFVMVKIKLSDPEYGVFFYQNRVGHNGVSFQLIKFRTMYGHKCSADGVEQTEENDHRVFSFGKVLRRKGLDELPQLINVFLGQMSLVGPRPHVAGQLAGGMEYNKLVPYYQFRHLVKPGITGWAQANGFRGSTKNADAAIARIDHDVAYIQNQSFWLDIKTIVLTLWHEVLHGVAH